MKRFSLVLWGGALLLGIFAAASRTLADTFGAPGHEFQIDFVTVGNPGNGDDAGAGGGLYFAPLGGVDYSFRISVTEVPLDWVTRATASGLPHVSATADSPAHPAGLVDWFEAAAFVNWLNTSTGRHEAYQLQRDEAGPWTLTPWETEESWLHGRGANDGDDRFRHKDAYYFLPDDDEWYKAAFHQNNGATADYWDYAASGNDIPTPTAGGVAAGTAVFGAVGSGAAPVDMAGGLSSLGTRGQGGNVDEWVENNAPYPDGTLSTERLLLGGRWGSSERRLRSSHFDYWVPDDSHELVGFRVASVVPEPTTWTLALLGVIAAGIVAGRRARTGEMPPRD